MRGSLLGVAVLFGSFLADKAGPMWWRLYWITVGLVLVRAAAILSRRLHLSRFAAALLIFAGTCAAFALVGDSNREVSAVIRSHWMWFAPPWVAAILFVLWERRHSPDRLRVLGTSSEAARFLDLVTLRYVPDLRGRDT